MTALSITLLAVCAAILLALVAWRRADNRAERIAWHALTSIQPATPRRFDPAMVDGLPEPARRFFRFAIRGGTPLYTVAEISMRGAISLGDTSKPNYLPMRARQVLAAPQGFIWAVRAGKTIQFEGSDGSMGRTSWSRFRLLGLIPVVRAGGNEDHARAAFGRCVAEALFWTPAAMLPGDAVRWVAVDDSTARVVVCFEGLEQAVDLAIDPDGQPTRVVFQRWSNANPDGAFRLQPFGGELSEFRDFDGYRLPTRIEAGNFFGTADYFPFFKANVTAVQFPAG